MRRDEGQDRDLRHSRNHTGGAGVARAVEENQSRVQA